MSFSEKLDKIINRYDDLANKLADPSQISNQQFIEYSKEYSELGQIVTIINEYREIYKQLKDTEELLVDNNIDTEMKEIAEEEFNELQPKLEGLEHQVKLALLPKDKDDNKNVILEIRAGTGGEEAALFAMVLLKMYQRYAENKGWKFEILEFSSTGIGGLKEASATISGNNVFAALKFESGVHRVQRVPETESSGRIHTSAATVAVLPEAEDFELDIEDKDLRIDVFRASGAGGQHVNTTESAVRIVHIPTGMTVSMQDEKSQHKNREKALKVLKARLYEHEKSQIENERSAQRKGQVGSGDRSERIRTYNYPQGRVTDHRINLTLYKITEITQEGQLDEIINALISENESTRLSESI